MNILIFMAVVVLLSSLMFWKKRGSGISLIVPFQCSDNSDQRKKNWAWLYRYWKEQLPGAQIIVGKDWRSLGDPSVPFSKSCAVNSAASFARGDVFVIMDADGYMKASDLLKCVKNIRKARKKGQRLWYVPYRQFYRLTPEASARVLESSPRYAYEFPTPPNQCDVQNTSGSQLGHWYGAGVQILPREAFFEVGGWDERFRGWGGEDHAAMRATDTLYWLHKTLPGQFLHIWHPMLSPEGASDWVDWKKRMWENQSSAGLNEALSGRYYGAYGDRKRMRKLVLERFQSGENNG